MSEVDDISVEDSDDESLSQPLQVHPRDLELMVKDLRQRVQVRTRQLFRQEKNPQTTTTTNTTTTTTIKRIDSRMPGSIVPRSDPAFLSKFLRTKDYNMEKALEGVHKYYACIYRNLDFIQGVRPSECTAALNTRCFSILKHRFNRVGVCVGRIKYWKTKEIELKEFQLAAMFLAENYISTIEIQEGGVSAIIDLEGLAFEHAWRGSVKEIRRTLQVALEGLPIRVKSIHILNPPMLFWSVYKIGQRFMKEKIRKRIHFHYNFESLHQHFDKKYLPHSLGGDLDEDEAVERHITEEFIKKDVKFEAYWNGQMGRPLLERRLSRKRSSDGFYVHPMIH